MEGGCDALSPAGPVPEVGEPRKQVRGGRWGGGAMEVILRAQSRSPEAIPP